MKWHVPKKEAPLPLLAFLKTKLNFSGKKIKRALDENFIRVNGAVERFGTRVLRGGEEVDSDLDKLETAFSEDAKKDLAVEKDRILFEDEFFLFYNKPAGCSSDEKGLLRIFKDFFLVHRLDKDTTGVILFAKTQSMQQKMIALFRARKVDKEYLALVDGVPKALKGRIENFFGKCHEYQGQSVWGPLPQRRGGRLAITEWKRKKKGADCALLQCFPKTGRTHQIRAHLKEMGHPILGDYQYARGFRCQVRPFRYMLHARKLAFVHPVTGKKVEVKADPPADFLAVEKDVLL